MKRRDEEKLLVVEIMIEQIYRIGKEIDQFKRKMEVNSRATIYKRGMALSFQHAALTLMIIELEKRDEISERDAQVLVAAVAAIPNPNDLAAPESLWSSEELTSFSIKGN